MKKTLLFLIVISLQLLAISLKTKAQSSIPDGAFTYWNPYTWMDPQNYFTSNDPGNGNNLVSGEYANVTQTTGKYGNYGVQIKTIVYDNDTMPGYIVNANSNCNGLTGGIPYNQKPTGVRFWYKYTTTAVDTAAVLVMFMKSGVIIDSFLIAIPSSASTPNYTLYSHYPSHSLLITPDTVIFGAVSSIGIMSNKKVVPGSTFVIDSVTFTGVGGNQPAALNGNFENWTPDTLNIPPGWSVSYPKVTFTTDACKGTYSLKLVTAANGCGSANPGQAGTGCYNNCNNPGGFPFTNQKDTLEFWYKYAPAAGDTALVNLNFIKNGAFIAGAQCYIFQPAAVCTYTTIPFDAGQIPDTAIVTIFSSNHPEYPNGLPNNFIGTTLIIDNLTFASQKKDLSVNKLTASADKITVYPNPAKDVMYISLSEPSEVTLSLIDVLGQNVYSGQLTSSDKMKQLNLSGIKEGIYFLKMAMSDGSMMVKKIEVVR